MTAAPPPPLGLAVIGHVNHGKTALVRALTGMETDRLPEEKARGLSIALGFAFREDPDGDVDFLDAPGHEDFIRAMVMGAAGARAVLLVVSAVEGFGRQTREHLRIASLLGLRDGLVAVTKADLVPPEARTDLRARLMAELEESFLATAPVVFCSAVTGEGLGTLNREIHALALRTPPPERLPGAFLPLDRVFSLAGTGTVVTGSLQGGDLEVGDEAVLEPSGRTVHLRQLQVHGQAVPTAPAGGRAAAALRGVSPDEVRVGEVLCSPGSFPPTVRVDLEVDLSPEAARPLRSGDEVRVLWGARQDLARARLIGGAPLEPGSSGLVQLRFSGPVPAHAGQRLLLRRPSPAGTLGGGRVLDPVAPQLRARTLEARRDLLLAVVQGGLEDIAAALAGRDGGAVSVAEAACLSRAPIEEVRSRLAERLVRLDDSLFAQESAVEAAAQAYLDRLADAHRAQPTRAFVALGALRGGLQRILSRDLIAHVEGRLVAEGGIRIVRGQAALKDHDPFAALSPAQLSRLGEIETALREGGMNPPDAAGLVAEGESAVLLGLLVESGRLVSLRNHALRQTLVFHIEALDAALSDLEAAFPPPAEFTTGEARAALSTSRKFIVPALEFLDSRGDTVRRGDSRQVVTQRKRFGTPPIPH